MSTNASRIVLARLGLAATMVVASSAMVLGKTALAQANQGSGPPNGLICMERNSTAAGGLTSQTRASVPATEEQKLLGRGFVRSNCGKARNGLKSTRQPMCTLADVNDPQFASEFMNRPGLTPAGICELAARLPTSL